VDGDTIYVQTPSGIVRVKTTKSTKVTIARKSTAKSLKTGAAVVVQGTPGQDGTVTATSVQGG
jgi:ribosomal protein S8E